MLRISPQEKLMSRRLVGYFENWAQYRPAGGGFLPDQIDAFACDTGANSEQTRQPAAQWEQYNPGRVSIYEFPAALGIPHDIIDPNQPDAKTQITYPKILELLRVKPS